MRERDASNKYRDLAKIAKPAMAQFLGNGELEGDFSRIKHVGVKARGCDGPLLRSIVKLLVDGPRPGCIADE